MPGLHGDVERGRGLVGDQQLRLAGERDRDRDALAHAAGELVREARRAPPRGRGCAPRASSATARARGLALRQPEVAAHVLGQLPPDRAASGAARSADPGTPSRSRAPRTRAQRALRQAQQVAAAEARRARRPARRAAAGRAAPAPTSSCRCRSRRRCPRPCPARRRSRRRRRPSPRPSGAGSRTPQVLDLEQRASRAPRRPVRTPRGSKTSRRLSPRKLKASTAVKMARPGNVLIHQFWKYSVPVGDHRAPLGRRRLGAEAEERQAREQQDRVAEVERRQHDHRPEHVRQHVAEQRRARRGAEQPARLRRTRRRRPRAPGRARRARRSATRRRPGRAPRCGCSAPSDGRHRPSPG